MGNIIFQGQQLKSATLSESVLVFFSVFFNLLEKRSIKRVLCADSYARTKQHKSARGKLYTDFGHVGFYLPKEKELNCTISWGRGGGDNGDPINWTHER